MKTIRKNIFALCTALVMMASSLTIGASATTYAKTKKVTDLNSLGSREWRECRIYSSTYGYMGDVYLVWTNTALTTKGYCKVTNSDYWHYASISGKSTSASADTKAGYIAKTSKVKPGSSNGGTLTVGGCAWN